ncbi:MAG: hypothetical protein KC731_25555, partial [Myxococcales bacterium]|nr:hypothetical protein [Myxococcales bacterium]
CVVEQAPPANASGSQAQSRPAHCGESQDACVARCKAQAPDEASRQPCYNQCMHQSQQCR